MKVNVDVAFPAIADFIIVGMVARNANGVTFGGKCERLLVDLKHRTLRL